MKLFKPLTHPLLVLMLALLPLTGCTQGPMFLSWQEEIRIGEEASPQFLEQSGGQLPDEQVVSYVRSMGMQLAGIAEQQTPDADRPALDWEFHVLDSQVINAFALPGGKVFISRGLMENMTNDAQLAGVVGHEIAHVMARHGNQRMSKAMILQGVVIAAGVAGAVSDEEWMRYLGLGTAVGGQLFLLKYSRSNELEADELGVQYMAAAGYNPVGQMQLMQLLGEISGGGGPPEWLSTHPVSETRVDNLEQLILEQYPRYKDPSFYKMGLDSYRKNIKAPLSKLPPAKHGRAAMISPDQFEQDYGMPWQQAASDSRSRAHPHQFPHLHRHPHPH